MATENGNKSAPGIGVDSHGGAVVDPTANVIALTDAAVKRIDDMANLREQLVTEKITRMSGELVNQEKIAVLRAEHSKELRHMEADRVDKIRSVDVANAAATAAQLLSAVNTLATTAQTTAEVLRNQVAATATAVASQTERALNPILDRIALLEKSSYTGAGKAGMADPMMSELLTAVQDLKESRAGRGGKSEGIGLVWGVVVAVAVIVIAVMGLYLKSGSPAPAQQVIYVPTPSTVAPNSQK